MVVGSLVLASMRVFASGKGVGDLLNALSFARMRDFDLTGLTYAGFCSSSNISLVISKYCLGSHLVVVGTLMISRKMPSV